jgi:hypothetical protein
MTDPAVAYLPDSDYGAYDRGKEAEIWLKAENGSDFLGVVWPGKCTKSFSHNCQLTLLRRCDCLSR